MHLNGENVKSHWKAKACKEWANGQNINDSEMNQTSGGP